MQGTASILRQLAAGALSFFIFRQQTSAAAFTSVRVINAKKSLIST
jgi:hypothetical protein